MKKTGEHKPYVGDVGAPLETTAHKAGVGFSMVMLATIVGFVIGLVVWAVFWASSALTELLWVDGRAYLEGILSQAGVTAWWLPIAFCGIGGLAIGFWTRFFGGQPESLENVMASVKFTGGYRLERPGASVVGFLLPLVFGGSIGPEAGLTGIIAAACTRIGASLRAAGIRAKRITDVTVSAALSAVFASPFLGVVATAEDGMPALDPNDYELRRKAKFVLYTASALGAIIGIALFTSVFGKESGIPRFDGVTPGINKLWWALPCMLLGYLAVLIFRISSLGFAKVGARLGDHLIAKPVAAGLILGALAVPLPYVLFSGEVQSFELMRSWASVSGAVLVATGLVKCAATPLCINLGWRGGRFFPVIFAGVSLGYGIASIGGFEPMFCVAITTATLVAAVQRKALVALAMLLLCFPVQSIPWIGVACLIGAALPLPGDLKASRRTAKEQEA